jgi:hypothetical protein
MWGLLVSALVGGLTSSMGSFVGRAMIAAGVGVTTYSGISLGISSVKASAISGVNSLGSDALGLVGYLWLDKGLTIIFSAFTAALTMKLVGGSIKKMVMK